MLHSPFHAAMEIMTSRMLINLYKAHRGTADFSLTGVVQPMRFISSEGVELGHSEANTRFWIQYKSTWIIEFSYSFCNWWNFQKLVFLNLRIHQRIWDLLCTAATTEADISWPNITPARSLGTEHCALPPACVLQCSFQCMGALQSINPFGLYLFHIEYPCPCPCPGIGDKDINLDNAHDLGYVSPGNTGAFATRNSNWHSRPAYVLMQHLCTRSRETGPPYKFLWAAWSMIKPWKITVTKYSYTWEQ